MVTIQGQKNEVLKMNFVLTGRNKVSSLENVRVTCDSSIFIIPISTGEFSGINSLPLAGNPTGALLDINSLFQFIREKNQKACCRWSEIII